MFRRKNKAGKPVGNYYCYHPVTGRKVTLGTDDKVWAKDKLRLLERERYERETGNYVPVWEEISEPWMEVHQHLANRRSQEEYHAFWMPHLKGMKPAAIDKEYVHRVIMKERTDRYAVNLKEPSSANSTANMYVGFVAKILRSAGFNPPKFYKYKASNKSKPWLRPEQWPVLRGALPDDLRRIVTFGLATGLRIENMRSFEWAWLHANDTRAFLPPAVTKTDEPYGIPLNRSAQTVIAEIRKQPVRHATHVFTFMGQQWEYRTLLEALKRTCKRAGVPVLTPHCLRHTFRSWLAQEGVSDSVARRLGCWQLGGGADKKYLHFDVERLRRFSETLDPCLDSVSPTHENVVESSAVRIL